LITAQWCGRVKVFVVLVRKFQGYRDRSEDFLDQEVIKSGQMKRPKRQLTLPSFFEKFSAKCKTDIDNIDFCS
jgi:hypothetical protein